jgi:guanine deaminase
MTFRSNVARQVERLRSEKWADLERQTAEKRVAWCRQHLDDLPVGDSVTPRAAFETVFMNYMGLSEEDLPIVSESDQEIVWRSANPCDTLEACQELGLDTRDVCRATYEKSTQAMVSAMNPALRFLRSYLVIRPHATFCLERIVRMDYDALMGIAIEEARLSRKTGNKGYGAVVALGRDVLAQAHDTAAEKGDPILHAEVNALRAAIGKTGDGNLSGAVLVSSCEPCPMCATYAVWANVSAIVYGASIGETAAMGRTRIKVGAAEIVAASPALVEVIGGVRREECLELYA